MSLNKIKEKIAAQKAGRTGESPIKNENVGATMLRTPVAMKAPVLPKEPEAPPAPPVQQAPAPLRKTLPRRNVPQALTKEAIGTIIEQTATAPEPPAAVPAPKKLPTRPRVMPKLTEAQAESLLKGGSNVLAQPIPKGYSAVGKNDVDLLIQIKAEHIARQVCSLDYETTGDPDDETQDPQDHDMVGCSTAYEVGTAFYFPVGHDNYGANWDVEWFTENFLKPILEHPDILVIAHNIKFEHQISLLLGIDMYPKAVNRKVMDTMLMVKALSLPECMIQTKDGWEVAVGLKPSTKALLATTDGMVHGILHIDDIKSFTDTVGKHEWNEPTGEFYKTNTASGAKKGDPKMKKVARSRTFNELPINKETVDYGASDADWALGLYLKLMPMIEAEELADVLFELDVPFMMVLGEYELAGWHISREKLEVMRKVAECALYGEHGTKEEPEKGSLAHSLDMALRRLTANIAQLDSNGNVIVPKGVYGMGTYRGDATIMEIKTQKPFNWGSPQHKQWLFYHVLKMDTRDVSRSKDTGLPSTDAPTIDKLIENYGGDGEFMKVLKEKSKYDKILSTYVNGMLPFCRSDTDKIHTNMRLVSTWRLSSKKPNLQNCPRADNDPLGFRGVFIAPVYDPNGDYSHLNPFTKPVSIIAERKLSGLMFYVNSDYAQIELKVLAWYAGEKGMIDILANGGDLHSWVAHKVFKLACMLEEVKDLYKPFRYRAKKVNFGIVYGMTKFGLSKDPDMNMTADQAQQFIDEYMKEFPGVKVYMDEMIAFARKNGYVETIFRHRRAIPEINHPNQWSRASSENQAINTPIQGSASDIIRMAMVNIKREAPPWYKSIMQIHDELQSEIPVEYGVEGALFMKEVMERPIDGFTDIMPIISEPAIGATWDTALDLKFKPDGTPYVKPKAKKKEATDVTYDMIAPYENYYKLAGIEIA